MGGAEHFPAGRGQKSAGWGGRGEGENYSQISNIHKCGTTWTQVPRPIWTKVIIFGHANDDDYDCLRQ